MDFITQLPDSKGRTNIIVVTDRLGKGVMWSGLRNIDADTVAKWFVKNICRHHGPPRAIVSDRGTQFVGEFWKRVCQLFRIKRQLSTASHPQTDGATERANQELEAYLRNFCNHAQDDWYDWLWTAELAYNNKDKASTRVSPFFLSHGYHMEPLQLDDIDLGNTTSTTTWSPIRAADQLIAKLKAATGWAQCSMATAQQEQEKAANKRRIQAPSFKVGDKVWLDLRNIKTDRPSKKLDARYAKYTVIEVLGSHSFRLNTPPGIHNVFHSDLLRYSPEDPLPSQQVQDTQPPALEGYGDDVYEVEEIVDEKPSRGRPTSGGRRPLQYLIKWKGYTRPTWEPESALQENVALEAWEAKKASGYVPVSTRRR
jgi:hypothetical protein